MEVNYLGWVSACSSCTYDPTWLPESRGSRIYDCPVKAQEALHRNARHLPGDAEDIVIIQVVGGLLGICPVFASRYDSLY